MNSNAIREYYFVIKNKINEGRFQAALASINKLLLTRPKDEHAYYFKGICEFLQTV